MELSSSDDLGFFVASFSTISLGVFGLVVSRSEESLIGPPGKRLRIAINIGIMANALSTILMARAASPLLIVPLFSIYICATVLYFVIFYKKVATNPGPKCQ